MTPHHLQTEEAEGAGQWRVVHRVHHTGQLSLEAMEEGAHCEVASLQVPHSYQMELVVGLYVIKTLNY